MNTLKNTKNTNRLKLKTVWVRSPIMNLFWWFSTDVSAKSPKNEIRQIEFEDINVLVREDLKARFRSIRKPSRVLGAKSS